MKSMKVEVLFLVIALFVGVAANKAPLAYGEKKSLAYPVMYPTSVGKYDGWVLESSENSNVGGTKDSTGTTFIVGDDAARRQFRGVLHFNTAALPDNAVVTRAVLRIRRQSGVGSNPFTVLGRLYVDMRRPYFGTPSLELTDFQAKPGKSRVAAFDSTPVSGWYHAILNASGRGYINRSGSTQFRLYFDKDDNNNKVADYVKFYSGNYSNLKFHPILEIQYYEP